MKCILEFAHDKHGSSCDYCGSNWAEWCTRDSIAECVIEAQRQNEAWKKDGSPTLSYRIIVEVAKGVE